MTKPLHRVDVYAGGDFTQANIATSISVNHIVRWSGDAWSALGSGVDSSVMATGSGTTVSRAIHKPYSIPVPGNSRENLAVNRFPGTDQMAARVNHGSVGNRTDRIAPHHLGFDDKPSVTWWKIRQVLPMPVCAIKLDPPLPRLNDKPGKCMCRVLAYIGPEIPIESLLLEPENSLLNQSLEPELYPRLHLAGWGFGIWSEHLLKPEEPFLYHRPMAAFYDNNAQSIIPSLQGSTLLAHIRAASYNSLCVLADENCHPFSFEGTPWIIAHNGDLPNWKLLQRELLQHCEDRYLKQMRGTTDTEFLYVLLLSLLDGDSDEDVKKGFEKLLKVILAAMKKLDLVGLTKLKIALVAPNRIIGVNYGVGHRGGIKPEGDWKELKKSDPDSDEHALSMLLEPMYLLIGKDFQNHPESYKVDPCPVDEATSAIFASEPLTDDPDEWLSIKFGEIVFLERKHGKISRTVSKLKL